MTGNLQNLLSDVNLFGPSRGGVAGTKAKLAEIFLSNDLSPFNLLMQCSSAFRFITATVSTGDAEVRALWNGTNALTGAGAGDITFTFNPGFADPVIDIGSAGAGDAIVPIIILDVGGSDVNFSITSWTRSGGITTAAVAETNSAAGTGASLRGWALFIGKRAMTYDHLAGAPDGEEVAAQEQKDALIGGPQTSTA